MGFSILEILDFLNTHAPVTYGVLLLVSGLMLTLFSKLVVFLSFTLLYFFYLGNARAALLCCRIASCILHCIVCTLYAVVTSNNKNNTRATVTCAPYTCVCVYACMCVYIWQDALLSFYKRPVTYIVQHTCGMNAAMIVIFHNLYNIAGMDDYLYVYVCVLVDGGGG